MAPQTRPPATPSPSATLIPLRNGSTGMEVYLTRRSAASSFMPGTYVFPGGNLEPEDTDTAFWQNHVDLPVEQLARALGGTLDQMLPVAVAAIRETWEEAGLLLAVPKARLGAVGRFESGGIPFNRRVAEHNLCLRISELGCWHHWITPVRMPQRFDTFFFVAPVPQDQTGRPDNQETVHAVWVTPRQALTENLRGSLPLSPPTLVTLHQMLEFGTLAELLAETRGRPWPPPIMPRLWPLEAGALIVEPWDPDYNRRTVQVDPARLEQAVLPVGAPFSRLWRHGGICRPVRAERERAEGLYRL
jgi:8-oxo-dGTP pyrophosphatase MutT (NUDIX family)